MMPYHGRMAELVFEVVQEPDGGYCAECLSAFFFDRKRPELVRLHLVRDEVLSVA